MAKQARGLARMDVAIRAVGVVFARDGYRLATMEAVMREAGLSQGSLYAHFGAKEALAHAVVARQREIFAEQMASQKGQGVAVLMQTLVGIAHAIASDPVVRGGIRLSTEMPDISSSADVDLWNEAIEEALIHGKVEGVVGPEVDATLVSRIISDSLLGIIAMCLATTDGADLEATARTYLAASLASVAS
ncbi:MAG: hypothetical protein B5766_12805 [Candidatus Lumbricidophila eiseniae]|uniref:HTH tetR-type domain-containing protein n=1 Tax=Candidatus Lumbricidiphila eiseniae TaxID=1969409 RepID=A0A2A6FMX7_9MICO|nr:MAG: hypothetical protein B5766_12805 [Candidatus Lumbricidophila eiseniae]